VDNLVLDHVVVEFRAIANGAEPYKRAIETHFLLQSSLSSGSTFFAWARMTTAGVRPESTGMIFAGTALLEQHSLSAVPDDDRKCAMQRTLSMDLVLLAGTKLPIMIVDENDFF
jgi:hypothetical protein